MAAAESCALDDDEEEEEDDEVSVTVPMKSFGLVNKIRSMTAYKVPSNKQGVAARQYLLKYVSLLLYRASLAALLKLSS